MPPIDISPLRDALAQLDKEIQEADATPRSELLRDDVIQRFEYSHELGLKFLRRMLEKTFGDDVDHAPYNELLSTAAKRGLIRNVEQWFDYRSARNQTSHTYDALIANEVYDTAKELLPEARHLLAQLDALVA